MMLPIILMTVAALLVLIMSFALHELGHYLYAKFYLNVKTTITKGFNVSINYKLGEVDKTGLYWFYFSGVIFGLLPIALFMLVGFYYSLILLVGYSYGCYKSDLKKMWGLVKV